jgi:hypothetical protein
MPRYRWMFGGQEAERQYDNLPEDSRRLVNQRIKELREDPIDIPDREHDPHNDTHTIPIGDDTGFMVYAVEENRRMVIGYRFTPGLN